MERPDDTADYEQCIKILPSASWVFCTKCDQWQEIVMTAIAKVTLMASGLDRLELDLNNAVLRCGVCHADIDYLFDVVEDRQIIVRQLTARMQDVTEEIRAHVDSEES